MLLCTEVSYIYSVNYLIQVYTWIKSGALFYSLYSLGLLIKQLIESLEIKILLLKNTWCNSWYLGLFSKFTFKQYFMSKWLTDVPLTIQPFY
jgi:hypothetical protein